jgi:hypothetical protein
MLCSHWILDAGTLDVPITSNLANDVLWHEAFLIEC